MPEYSTPGNPRPYKPISPEEVAAIDAALEKTNGNRVHAAMALGMDETRVYNCVRNNPHLRAKWLKKEPEPVEPGMAADMHREKPVSPFTPAEVKTVDALNAEDAALQKGWKRLGVSASDRKFLAGLQASYAGNFKSTMDLAYGGAAHANTRLLLALEDVARKLEHIREHPEEYHRTYMTEHGVRESKGPDEYYKEFYQIFIEISGELRKMSDSVTKANELRLKVERMRLAQQTKTRSEAGWDIPTKPAEKA